jgi:GDSL-like Lipase/Acylhydrolase family
VNGELRASVALLTLSMLVFIPYQVPGLQRLRLLSPLPEGESLLTTTPAVGEMVLADDPPAPAGSALPMDNPAGDRAIAGSGPPQPFESPTTPAAPLDAPLERGSPAPVVDASGRALDAFFQSLLAVENRRSPAPVARVTYWGDSTVVSDYITGALRKKLQTRFGDAGHGFLLMANAFPLYAHDGVERISAAGWSASRVVGPLAPDGFYGFGGVVFHSSGRPAFSRFATAKTGEIGRSLSRVVVDYLEHPEGGRIEVRIDGEPHEEIDTRAPTARSAARTYRVPDGPHAVEIRPRGAGVRAFGVSLERDAPGVIVDSIGIPGCSMSELDRLDDAHFREQLQLFRPSLVVFHYGMNEVVGTTEESQERYAAANRAVITQALAALPGASCLLVSPMDRVSGASARMASVQRKVAAETGCAFWDLYAAMGGAGSMTRWASRGLAQPDRVHPSIAGAEIVATWIDAALMQAYDSYKTRAPREPPR